MKKTILSYISAIILAGFFFTACNEESLIEPTSNNTSNQEPGAYIVVLKENISNTVQTAGSAEREVLGVINQNGISMNQVSQVYSHALRGFAAELTRDQLAALKNDPTVEYIEKDVEMSLIEPEMTENSSDATKNTILAQNTPWGITYIGGGVDYTGTNQAWIIDTGIDLDHPDLNVNRTLSKSFVTSGIDLNNPDDFKGHGTHVAGTIAAKNNTVGVIGVAAGAKVVAVKVLNQFGKGNSSITVRGLDYVYANGKAGDVVNLSLGGGASTTTDNAVKKVASKGILVAIAAGNSATSATNTSPARVNGTGIYTVSAHDKYGKLCSFSNYGNPPVDYAAPGSSVYSTYKGGLYKSMSGTSMATPHVAGILLSTGGRITSSGTITGDRDRTPDPKAHR